MTRLSANQKTAERADQLQKSTSKTNQKYNNLFIHTLTADMCPKK